MLISVPWGSTLAGTRRLGASVRSGYALNALAAMVATCFVAAIVDFAAAGAEWERLSWVLAATLAAAMVLVALPGSSGRVRMVRRAALLALGIWLSAQIAAWLAASWGGLGLVADALFGGALVPGVIAVRRATSSRLTNDELLAVGVDSVTVFCAVTTIMIWLLGAAVRPGSIDDLVAVAMPTLYFAVGGSSLISSLVVRARTPSYLVLIGVVTMGTAWLVADPVPAAGVAFADHGLAGALFPVGVLALALGCAMWTDESSTDRRYARVARALRQGVPLAVVVAVMAPMLLEHSPAIEPVMEPAIACTIVLAVVRQSLLIVRADRLAAAEREARACEREASERYVEQLVLARELASDRSTLARRLAGIDPADPLDVASRAACEALCGAFGFVAAGIAVRNGHSPAALATVGELDVALPDVFLLAIEPGDCAIGTLSGGASRLVRMRPPLPGDEELVLWAAAAPSVAEDWLESREDVWREAGALVGAVLAPGLALRRARLEARDRIEEIIARHEFRPVFQPIVELGARTVVGHEALTRFSDGVRPDLRFVEAAGCGLALVLERACLGAQVEAARALPGTGFLSVNVSPAAIVALTPVVSALEGLDRPVVLEVTEHATIEDYDTLRGRIAAFGDDVRISIDDAGSGYASLRHVLELRPAFVKLDISLVRSIDADPARSSIVAGLVHFARETGCELVAEGIETEAERERLVGLGVRFGQGYLLGRPEPVAAHLLAP